MPMRQQITEYIRHLQDTIVAALEALDPSAPKFKQNTWTRTEGGGGRSCTFGRSGADSVLEKAAINISMIHGTLVPPAIRQMSTEHANLPSDPSPDTLLPFFAGGISIIVHPRNPHAPAVHANYRYFEVASRADRDLLVDWWFGGVADLTPAYLYDDDARHFHRILKGECDAHGAALYPAFKQSCDEYFFIPHRAEHRGVGGIRFDNLSDRPHPLLDDAAPRLRSAPAIFALVCALGDAFIPSYVPLLSLRSKTPYDESMRRWLLLRRGRSVEFTLLYERGTKFGLAAPGVDPENVLAGMPEAARWEYGSELGAEEGTEEARLVSVLRAPREWA